jgi:arylsulfatase A-like enzyme
VLVVCVAAAAGCRGGEGGGHARGEAVARTAGRRASVAGRDESGAGGERADRAERTVVDLIAARPLATVSLGGALIIEGGGAAVWKHLDGGWKSSWRLLPAANGKPRRAAILGVAGVLHVALDEACEGPACDRRILMRLHNEVPGQAMTLFVNGRAAANLAVAEGVSTVEATIPGALLHAGDNTLRLHFRRAAPREASGGGADGKASAAAVERVVLGPPGVATVRDPGTPPRLGESYGLGGDARRALASSGAMRVSYPLVLPSSGAGLELAFAYGSQAASPGAAPIPMSARLVADGEGGPAAVALWRADARATWQEARVDLGRWAGRAVRLELAIEGSGGGAFAEPRVVTRAPAPSAGGASDGAAAEVVIVWMIDTLRFDRLGAGATAKLPGGASLTPNLDALLAEGTQFASATAQGNYSLPSHASILTGTTPAVHGLVDDAGRLPDDVPLVSERLRARGVRTGLFSSNGYISEKWGFRRGWDAYRNFIRENLPNGATEIWKAARPFLESEARAGKRVFLYLATAEPHVAYDPRPEFLARTWPRPYAGPVRPRDTAAQLVAIKRGSLRLSAVDKQYLEALYDAEVAQNDAAFGAMVADVKRMGLWDKTAIIVVSDHGDELFEHGSVGHGHSVYEELVRVPLAVRFPPRVPAGRVAPVDVEGLDVAPTVLDLFGLDEGDGPPMQGESLLRLARAPEGTAPRPATSVHGALLRAMRLGRYKLIRSSAKTSLYDLVEDPREQRDLGGDPRRAVALGCLRDVFALEFAFEPRWRKPLFGTPAAPTDAFADD